MPTPVSADRQECKDCGWFETPGDKNYRKCPECGAPFQTRYEKRYFGEENW